MKHRAATNSNTEKQVIQLPSISVITPSYNQGCFLGETIRSVLDQDYPALEYIVIDGGSTDNSVEIIQKYSDEITYWVSEKDEGQSAAINKGFSQATGDIVCWLNSDDLFLPGALKRVGTAFACNAHADIVTGYTIRTDAELRILNNHFIPRQLNWLYKKGVIYFSQQSTFWRKSLLERVGSLDESLHACMDVDLFARFYTSGARCYHIRDYLAVWRLHELCKTSEQGDIWDHDRVLLKCRYAHIRLHRPHPLAKLIYRGWKLLNGDYLRGSLFKLSWKNRPLGKFVENVMGKSL